MRAYPKNQLIGSMIALLIGTSIYILFRSRRLVIFQWMHSLGIRDDFISDIRKPFENIFLELPAWSIYSLPDGLWVFSFVSCALYIWQNSITLKSGIWIFSIPSMAIFTEIGQYLTFIPGTYDSMDVIFYVIGTVVPFLLSKICISEKNK